MSRTREERRRARGRAKAGLLAAGLCLVPLWVPGLICRALEAMGL